MQARRTLVGLLATTIVGSGLVVAQVAHAKSARAAARTAEKPAVDTPDVIAALQKMGTQLRNLQAFAVKAQTTTDDALASGQKIQYSSVVNLKVRRPDRLRVDVAGDRRNERMYYDGKTFTAFSERQGYYAQFDAPPTLNELKPVLEKRYGIDMPLADLFYWGTEQDATSAIKSGTLVGTSVVNGVSCDHYAIHQADIDWEIWIEQGAHPLPRKMVITTTTERVLPQHTMVLDWDLSPRLTDDLFTFSPSPNAHRIAFEQIDKGKTLGGAR
jgi:hypothetical protein